MKIGELVVCIKISEWAYIHRSIASVVVPKVGTTYRVRGIWGDGESIYLEEIINKPLPLTNTEPSFKVHIFRKLTKEEESKAFIEELYS